MKESIKNGNADDIKDILKIRLHISDIKKKEVPPKMTQIQHA